MLSEGRGVPKNQKQAFSWFTKAAKAGNASGQFNVGISYLNGYGTSKDRSKALDWFQNAVAQGHEHAIEAMKQFGGLR